MQHHLFQSSHDLDLGQICKITRSGRRDQITEGQHINPILLGPGDAGFMANFSFPIDCAGHCWLEDHQGRFRLLSGEDHVASKKVRKS